MTEDLSSILSQKIYIPIDAWEWNIDKLPISIRLWNVLKRCKFHKLSDLHGKTFKKISVKKNCGRKTIMELHDLIAQLNSSSGVKELANFIQAEKKSLAKKPTFETIYIPQEARGLRFSAFPLSTRLINILHDSDLQLLGDLQGFSAKELKKFPNCGSHTISELKEFVKKIQRGEVTLEALALESAITPTNLSLADFVEFIEKFLAELPLRDQEILALRFAAKEEKPLTLEEIGDIYGLTRERIRQIQSKIIKKLKQRLGEAGEELFRKICHDCMSAVCPLTPQLLVYWTQKDSSDFQFSPRFYVRILAEITSNIPILAEGQITQGQIRNKRSSKICLEIRNLLSRRFKPMLLGDTFEQLKKIIGNLQEKEFLEALQFSNFLALHFESPDKPAVMLTSKRKASEFAYYILSESDIPLMPEEIIERAKERFGENAITNAPRSLANLPFYAEGFYLLDSRTIGLRKHFSLPENCWEKLRNDFFNLLTGHNRSFSTTEIISEKMFDWTVQTNASEAAQILRGDARFTDLHRFHFALADWEIEERGYLRDLVIKVLEQAGHPLTATEVHEQMQKSRSVAITSLSTILSQTDGLQSFGCGFYGLKVWGSKSKEFLLSNPDYINRFVSRSEPPLTFGDLCQKLEIVETEESADKLWRALRALPKIKFKPNYRTSETFLIHSNWRFERAIQKVLLQDEQPLSIYEIQWELNKIFGLTFSDKKFDAIKNCLQNNEIFVRTPQGKIMLNEQLDLADFDAEWLRYACVEILKEENLMLSADDLLEKLEAEEIADENISAEMLAVILRGSEEFEEIGINLFRAAK